jgi:hypothetical protein
MLKFLKNLFFPDGTTLINRTVGGFEKILVQLKLGIEKCSAEAKKVDTSIEELTSKKTELADVMTKANKLLSNVEKLLQ